MYLWANFVSYPNIDFIKKQENEEGIQLKIQTFIQRYFEQETNQIEQLFPNNKDYEACCLPIMDVDQSIKAKIVGFLR